MSAIRVNFYSTNDPTDFAGQKHGRLKVLDFSFLHPRKGIVWLCRCDCGTERYVDYFKVGIIKSCGCRDWPLGSLLHRDRLLKVLASMKDRCQNPKSEAFRYYGARGISVCQEWKNNSVVFYKWAIANGYKKGLQIDRIDNYKGYEPTNCRWVTHKQQQNNKRVHQDAREAKALADFLKEMHGINS